MSTRVTGPGESIAADEEEESARALPVGLAIASASLAVYVKTAYPTVPGGDAGELVFNSCSLGIAHPPGQFPAIRGGYGVRARA